VRPAIDLDQSATAITEQLVNIESVSGDEARLADAVEDALRGCPKLSVARYGNVVTARTDLGRPQRVVLAGHLDTVPLAGNVPAEVRDGALFGCGSSDMKSGLAVQLHIAQLVGAGKLDPSVDLTWFCYDCEEVDAVRNGLNRISLAQPELLKADLVILGEPTGGVVEGGCQGTIRADITTAGVRAHSARSWLGVNAIHLAAPILSRLADYQARAVDVEGLEYREGLSAVRIIGGVAGNVVPDSCTVTVNYRFAPDRSEVEATEHLRQVFSDYDVTVVDSAPAARPGLDQPLSRAFVEALGVPARAKLGWTDVARFAALGMPALNFGPGDPNLAHKPEESVEIALIEASEAALRAFLTR
jgi:succinyl-diaminopimelate desuccinylase